MSKISIFIPIYNEEDVLKKNIELFNSSLKNHPYGYEIFIVDDGSTDSSGKIAKSLVDNNSHIRYIRFDKGPTRRENLAKAFKKAYGDIIGYVDIDVGLNFDLMPSFVREIDNGTDIVIGSRYAKGARVKRKLLRFLVSYSYNIFIRFLFKTGIMDHECGFKLFRRDVLIKLVSEMGFDASLRRGIFWDVEIITRALRDGYKIKEMPLEGVERSKTALYFLREIKMLPYIFSFMRDFKGNG